MSLSDYQPETAVIAIPGGEFSVRALGVGDLTLVFRTYMEDMEAVGRILEGQINGRILTPAIGLAIAMDLIRLAPNFVSAVIALAAGEPEAVDKAAKLPLHAQVAALSAIARMTFQDVNGLGNILTTLLQAAGAIVPDGAPSI